MLSQLSFLVTMLCHNSRPASPSVDFKLHHFQNRLEIAAGLRLLLELRSLAERLWYAPEGVCHAAGIVKSDSSLQTAIFAQTEDWPQ